MNGRDPASLTSSLLARKGDAAPSDDGAENAEGIAAEASPHIGLSAGIRPGEAGASDNFLTRGPEVAPPKISNERETVESRPANPELRGRRKPSRARRLPLMILASLIVVVLAGGAWFAAKTFIGDSSKTGRKKIMLVSATQTAPPAPPASGASIADPAPKKAAKLPAAATAPPSNTAMKKAATVTATKLPPLNAPKADTPKPDLVPVKKTIKKTAAIPPPAPAKTTKAPKPTAAQVRKTAAKTNTKTASASAGGGGTFGVQLSSVKRPSSAKKELNRLARKYASILEGAPLRVRKADLGKRGTAYRIQSATVLSSAKAKLICARLKFKKQPCIIIGR